MKKNMKWFLTLGVTTVMTINGLALAVQAAEVQADQGQRPAIAAKGELGHNGHMKERVQVASAKLLEFLNIDKDTLKSERQAGKSLVTIAKEHGVTEEKLTRFMMQEMTQRIEEGVKAGKIPAEKAVTMKENMQDRIAKMINANTPLDGQTGHLRERAQVASTKLLEFLNMDKDTLKSERQAGKSLVTIAKEHGVTEEKLTRFMMQEMTQRIEEGVKAGKLSAEKAEQMKQNMQDRVVKIINSEGLQHNRS